MFFMIGLFSIGLLAWALIHLKFFAERISRAEKIALKIIDSRPFDTEIELLNHVDALKETEGVKLKVKEIIRQHWSSQVDQWR